MRSQSLALELLIVGDNTNNGGIVMEEAKILQYEKFTDYTIASLSRYQEYTIKPTLQ